MRREQNLGLSRDLHFYLPQAFSLFSGYKIHPPLKPSGLGWGCFPYRTGACGGKESVGLDAWGTP